MKTLAALLLPNLALWGLIVGLFIWGARTGARGPFGQGFGGGWIRIAVVALIILAIPALPRAALVLWSVDRPVPDSAQPDVVVVFAAGIGGTSEHGYWPSGESMRRATVGASLAKSWDVPLVISGGARGDAPSEASVIADALDHDGAVVLEETARDTYENATATVALAREKAWRAIVLVTDGRHGRRALAGLASAGGPVVGFVPADGEVRFTWLHAVPSVQGLADWRTVGYEVAASANYIARGRIGVGDLFLDRD